MLSDRITACIFAANEERRIAACIEDLRDVFPLLVVDNCSTDRTVEVARGLGVPTISVRNPGYIETDSVIGPVEQAITTPYLLMVSVSELLPLPLLRAYADIAQSGCADVVRARRISFTAGEPIPVAGRPGLRHPGELRFFRKGSVDFSQTVVHSWGTPRPDARVQRLDDSLHFYHYRDYDCSRSEQAQCRYNDVQAPQLYARGRRFALWRALGHCAFVFLRAYFWMGCRRYGAKGFLESAHMGLSTFSVYLRLLEIEHGLGLAHVRTRNESVRQQHRQRLHGELAKSGVRP